MNFSTRYGVKLLFFLIDFLLAGDLSDEQRKRLENIRIGFDFDGAVERNKEGRSDG